MSLNFAQFKAVKTANERASTQGVQRGQSFIVKFRKFISKKGGLESPETSFYVSDKKFDELDLSNKGLIQLVSPEGQAYIATVDNENATMMKRTDKLKADAEKGKKFKSTILEDALNKSGIIDLNQIGSSQNLDLVKVGENQEVAGVMCYGIFEIVKGEDLRSETEKASETSEEAETVEAPVAQDANAVEETAPVENTSAPEVDEDF